MCLPALWLPAGLPLDAAVQAIAAATLASSGYTRDVCSTLPLASPGAQAFVDVIYVLMDWVAVCLPFPLAPPSIARPGTHTSRCQAVLTLLQLSIGLALPVALMAVAECQEYAAWRGAQQQQRVAGSGGGGGNGDSGWREAVYGRAQGWIDGVRCSPWRVGMHAVQWAALAWHALVLWTVPA